MSVNKPKTFVAVSGGVDSSVAAALLQKQGHNCTGVFMITNDCAQGAQSDAEKICKTLGIELHVLDLREDFKSIFDYFCSEYANARTPNPCVYCNRVIKFGLLYDFAMTNGADFFATGQYARIIHEDNDHRIYQANNIKKDQSYILAMLNRNVLKNILFPVGDFDKNQIRKIASQLGLHVENKKDSQEICFIPDNDHISFLEEHCDNLPGPGNVIDTEGKIVGQHKGLYRYTIGQRRGLGIALLHPAYVTRLNPAENAVTLGKKEHILSKTLFAQNPNWLIDPPVTEFEALVKIRYNHKGAKATVQQTSSDAFEVHFDEPVSAVTPGQYAVIYTHDQNGYCLAGAGTIQSATD